MKKSVAIIMALCMLMSLLPVGMVWADEAATTPTLLFEMDINGTDGAKVDQTTTTVTATTATQQYLETKEGDTKWTLATTGRMDDNPSVVFHKEGDLKYLTFREYDKGTGTITTTRARVVVPMDPNLEIANKDALTFETWVRPSSECKTTTSNVSYGSIFSFGCVRGAFGRTNIKNASAAFAFDWQDPDRTDIPGLRFQPDNKANTSYIEISKGKDLSSKINVGGMGEFHEKWVHLVITREWNSSKKEFKTQIYVNGSKIAEGSQGISAGRTDYSKDSTTVVEVADADPITYYLPYSHLVIGSGVDDDGFKGDIATFKMYDGVLDAAAVRQSYVSTRSTFYETDETRKIFDLSVKDGVITMTSDENTPGARILPTEACKDSVDPIAGKDGNIEYLSFLGQGADAGTQSPEARVMIKLNDIGFPDEDEMTVAAWVRQPFTAEEYEIVSGNSGRPTLFSLGEHPGLERSGANIFRAAYGKNASNTALSMLKVYDDGEAWNGSNCAIMAEDLAEYNGVWTHYVITKKWVPTEEGATSGNWEHNLYINGKPAAATPKEIAVAERKVYSEYAGASALVMDSTDYFVIGGSTTELLRDSFNGDIAEFALYDGELNATDVSKLYKSGLRIFNPGVLGAEFTNQDDEALTSLNIASATKVNVAELEIDGYTAENAPFAVLAVYKENELKGCKIVATAVDTETDIATISASYIDGITAGGIDNVKLFVWDSVSNVRPLFKASCL